MPLSNKTDEIRNSFLVNIHWGIQRMISRTWQIAARLGAGYAADVEYNFGTIYPSLDFVFSYVFSEKNK